MVKQMEKTISVLGYAATKAKARLELFQYELKELGPWDVSIQVSHCGICHSDIHLIDDDWNFSKFPLVPGHEIVGKIIEKGERVAHLKIGDRVGVGWQAGSCMNCEWCEQGEEHLCSESRAVCVGNYGGFGEQVVADGRFAFPIPKSISSEAAAPLLCGGVTVYSPFRQYEVRPFMKVGVIGIGGLGHLALQFADAFGCEVFAFSTSAAKEQDAKKFGADHFVLSKNSKAFGRLKHSLDFILSTVNVNLDWGAYMELLRPKGKLCFVGVPPGDIKAVPFSLIVGERSMCGRVIGNRRTIREMLEFSARHKIGSRSEIMPIASVNDALERVRQNQARYRVVLKH
jgi:uncharacterized zinc-type alcohol dehydrogenase-like protein